MSKFDALKDYKMVYMASVYTKYPRGIHEAYKDASALAGEMVNAGVKVFSPIAHSHPIAIYGAIDPLAHDIWLALDDAFLDASEAMVVAMMDGWTESKGIAYELDYMRQRGKPIYYWNLETGEVTLGE